MPLCLPRACSTSLAIRIALHVLRRWNQKQNSIGIETTLGENSLVLLGFEGHEKMSSLFYYSLEVASERPDIEAKELIGEKINFWVKRQDGQKHHLNGYIKSFSRLSTSTAGYRHYCIEVVPWLWFLTKSLDCCVFQNMSVIEVIEDVLNKDQHANFKIKCSRNYMKQDYCVKYQETDFEFISRLLNHNGLFYYFSQEKGLHTLIISDQVNVYQECEEDNIIQTEGALKVDHISQWKHHFNFFSGSCSQRDFNYDSPSNDLTVNSKSVIDLPVIKNYELYHYPGNYLNRDVGIELIDQTMAREEQNYENITGVSSYSGFHAGVKFLVKSHDFADEIGKEYLLVYVKHAVTSDTHISGGQLGTVYHNSFEAIPASLTYLNNQLLDKPIISGPQTAIVVGPKGEEIYTDKLGRVKIIFHWDRNSSADEHSSCWIRVSQTWAGNNWGGMSIPRIGQEVVVSFLNGDPDRPIITGSVYNGENTTPYELPLNATMSGIKTNSSSSGKGFNELRFEDKNDEEQIFLHAQKNMDTRIKNSSFETIQNSKHVVIGNNRFEHVKNERHVQIDSHHIEDISGDRHIKVKGGKCRLTR